MDQTISEDKNKIIEEVAAQFYDKLPPSWPHDARSWASISLAVWSVNLEYSDRFRWCRVTIPSELAQYCEIQNRGCCGYKDEVFFINGEPYLVGCNYGH